jgi:hypothetical protein
VADDRPTLLGRAGMAVGRVYPHVDRDLWLLRRRLDTRAARRDLDRFASTLQLGRTRPAGDVHLVVVVHHGPDAPNWRVAGGNHFFEVHQSAIEALGADRVTLFGVGQSEPTPDWHRRLLTTVAETGATHLIAQVETDPNQPGSWNWDIVLPVLSRHWQGATIGMMYDSAYEWLRIRAHRMGRLTGNLLIAELCEPMSGFVRPGQYEVGPMTMPLSQASVAVIDEYVRDLPKVYDVSFIGALYDYRVDLLDLIRAHGLTVAENPHRADAVHTYDESRTNQPTYLDYMAGLARSELTINFSLAHGGPHEQYKIRVHEASLVRCICLTDDGDRSRHFFAPNEYQFFPSVEALPDVIAARLADRDALAHDQAAASTRAHELSRTDYWGRIDVGLERRGLPRLTGITPPAEPA